MFRAPPNGQFFVKELPTSDQGCAVHLGRREGAGQKPLEGVRADQGLQRPPRQAVRQRLQALDLLYEPRALLLWQQRGVL